MPPVPWQDIVLTLQEKLSIRSIAHFALVLEEQYNLAKIHLLHEEELIAQVSRVRGRGSPVLQGEPSSAPAMPSSSAMVFPHIPGDGALWERPECPHTQRHGEQSWVASFVPHQPVSWSL